MKTVVIVILIFITNISYSQSRMDMMEKYIRTCPHTWESGFSIEEVLVNKSTGSYLFKINNGAYWDVHREVVDSDLVYGILKVNDVLYSNKTLYIWIDDGVIKSSFDGVVSNDKHNVILAWEVNFTITEYKIVDIEFLDNRGLTLPILYNSTKY